MNTDTPDLTLTGEDWMQIVDWIAERFPDSQWHPEQAVAYYDDLADFDSTDVWSALFSLYERGLKFAPNGSVIMQEAIRHRREAAVDTVYRALPAPSDGPPATWDSFTINRFGKRLTPQEVINRLHATLEPCGNDTCQLHYPVKEGQDA